MALEHFHHHHQLVHYTTEAFPNVFLSFYISLPYIPILHRVWMHLFISSPVFMSILTLAMTLLLPKLSICSSLDFEALLNVFRLFYISLLCIHLLRRVSASLHLFAYFSVSP